MINICGLPSNLRLLMECLFSWNGKIYEKKQFFTQMKYFQHKYWSQWKSMIWILWYKIEFESRESHGKGSIRLFRTFLHQRMSIKPALSSITGRAMCLLNKNSLARRNIKPSDRAACAHGNKFLAAALCSPFALQHRQCRISASLSQFWLPRTRKPQFFPLSPFLSCRYFVAGVRRAVRRWRGAHCTRENMTSWGKSSAACAAAE